MESVCYILLSFYNMKCVKEERGVARSIYGTIRKRQMTTENTHKSLPTKDKRAWGTCCVVGAIKSSGEFNFYFSSLIAALCAHRKGVRIVFL